jgi:hypothetical protein
MLELDVCAPVPTAERPYARAPFLVHGQTFLELRELIGRALFGAYDDYREWAMTRAERNVREQLEALRSDLPPDLQLTPAQLEAVGTVLHQRAATPEEGRPHIHLVEWLGDLRVQETALVLERELAAVLLQHDAADAAQVESIVASWPKLQQWFPPATSVRILTPLIPAYDPDRQRIGFYRFLLPSPRQLGGRPELVPARPLGFETLRWMIDDRRIAALLLGRVRLESIDYASAKRRELIEADCFAARDDPAKSWRRVGLTLTVDDFDIPLRLSAYWSVVWPPIGAEPGEPLCVRVDKQQDGPAALRDLAVQLAESLDQRIED